MSGPVALVGGNEWREPARPLDEWLLAHSSTRGVTVLPTAAAAEGDPRAAVETARGYFASIGAEVDEVMITKREEALDKKNARRLARAPFIYIAGGDPIYLADALRDTPAWDAIREASDGGAVLAGSSAGAMVMCDRMIRPTTGEIVDALGIFKDVVVLPHHDRWRDRLTVLLRRIEDLGTRLLGIDVCTGFVVELGRCRILGAGSVTMYRGGKVVWTAPAPAEQEDECL